MLFTILFRSRVQGLLSLRSNKGSGAQDCGLKGIVSTLNVSALRPSAQANEAVHP